MCCSTAFAGKEPRHFSDLKDMRTLFIGHFVFYFTSTCTCWPAVHNDWVWISLRLMENVRRRLRPLYFFAAMSHHMNDWVCGRDSFIIALELQIKHKLHEHKWFYCFSTVFNVCLECKLITAVRKKKKKTKRKVLLQILTRCVLLLCVITVSIPPSRWRREQRHFKGSASLQL